MFHGLQVDLSLTLLEIAALSSALVTHCLMYKNISKMCQELTLTSMKMVTSWMIHIVLFQTVKVMATCGDLSQSMLKWVNMQKTMPQPEFACHVPFFPISLSVLVALCSHVCMSYWC